MVSTGNYKIASLISSIKSFIGVLATKGTLTIKLFEKTVNEYTKNIFKVEQHGEGLVSLIENGQIDSMEMAISLDKYLRPMLEKNIDHLVLGCTHYPYLIPQIKNIIGTNIKIIDSGEAVAKQAKAVLEKFQLLSSLLPSEIQHQLITNSSKTVLEQIVSDVQVSKEIIKMDF